jgi:hypothetical protein
MMTEHDLTQREAEAFVKSTVGTADNWAALAPKLLWPLWGAALGAATPAYYYRRRGRS